MKTSDYDLAVDSDILICYKAGPQDISRYDTGVAFASCLNAKVQESKFGATIGSIITSDEIIVCS